MLNLSRRHSASLDYHRGDPGYSAMSYYGRQQAVSLQEQEYHSRQSMDAAYRLAVHGQLNLKRAQLVGEATFGNHPDGLMLAAEYSRAVHAVNIAQILKFGV